MEYNFPRIDSDYSILIEAAKNFAGGLGFVNAVVSAGDLNNVGSAPLQLWPVGYSMLLLPIYFFVGDWILAHIILQIISVWILIYGIIKLFRYFNVSMLVTNLFLLYFSFTATPFFYLGTSDLLTGGLFVWITFLTLGLINEEKRLYKASLAISFLLAFSSVIRYACIPNIVIIPAALLLIGLLRKKNWLLKSSAIIFSVTVFLILFFFHFYPISSGRTSFVENVLNLNFNWDLLRWFDSFPVKSLFYTIPIEFRLPSQKLNLIAFYRVFLHVLSASFLFYLCWFLFSKFRYFGNVKRQDDSLSRKFSDYATIFFVSFLVIVGFLSLQSIAGKIEYRTFGPAWMPQIWTFVYNTRYFIIPLLQILILFFLVFNQTLVEKSSHSKVFSAVFFFAFISAFLYSGYINFQIYSANGNGGGSVRVNCKDDIAAYYFLKDYKKKFPGKNLVVVTRPESAERHDILGISEAFRCFDYEKIIQSEFKNAKPMDLFIQFPKDKISEDESGFIHKFNAKPVLDYEKSALYHVELH